MFETYLSALCNRLNGVTDVAVVSYEGYSLEHYVAPNASALSEGLLALTPLLQQMKTGFALMGLGKISVVSMEGANQKVVCWPINEQYLLCLIGDVDERDGRLVFELSTVATQIEGLF